jgi:hypothetical protein
MQSFGITPSFSRPSVSDENAFAESLLRHLKYAPTYPQHGFATVDEAKAWVDRFVHWYNHELAQRNPPPLHAARCTMHDARSRPRSPARLHQDPLRKLLRGRPRRGSPCTLAGFQPRQRTRSCSKARDRRRCSFRNAP